MREKQVLFPGLAAVMAQNGDKYEDIAKLLDISISAVSRRMIGEVEWNIGEIKIVCEHYGKSFYELFD